MRVLGRVVAVLSLGLAGSFLQAQQVERILQPVDDTARVRVAGSVRADLMRATDLGPVDATLPVNRMLLVLKRSDAQEAALQQLLADQQDPTSARYHQWLKPEQFAAQFGPAAADVERIQQWLTSQGFSGAKLARGGQWMEFSGTAGQVAAAFRTEMHRYSANGEVHVGNASEVSLPVALAPVVRGLASLNNVRPQPMHTWPRTVIAGADGRLVPMAELSQGVITPQLTTGSATHYLTPGDMAAIYNTGPLYAAGTTGTGSSIAVIGETDVQLSDIETFRSTFGLPFNDPVIVLDGPDPGITSNDEFESDLDLEYAGAMAPAATIYFVEASSTESTGGIDLAAGYAVDNLIAPIISLSYGSCEAYLGTSGNAFYSQMWQQAAAEGITVFVSSGDSGSAGCDNASQSFPAIRGYQVSGIASTPYTVTVGGTEFAEGAATSTYWNSSNSSTFSSAVGYIPETVWNESCDTQTSNCTLYGAVTELDAGSGGKSGCLNPVYGTAGSLTCSGAYAKPVWQSGSGVPADGVRDIPDVSLAAAGGHDGYIVCSEGSCQVGYQNGALVLRQASITGGTSASTPSMAGIMALVEQKNGMYVGQANTVLYKLAAAQNMAACNSSLLTTPGQTTGCVFHDVTTGTNGVPCYGASVNCPSTANGVDGVLPQYAAGVGYDLASGLGSVDAYNLTNAWATAALQPTVATLTATASNIVHGTAVPFTVTVASKSGSGTPTGDVSLNSANGSVGTFTLSSGSYQGSTSALPGGSYSMTAHYGGDGVYASSNSAGVNVTITPESSTISLAVLYLNQTQTGVVAISGPVGLGVPLYAESVVMGASGQGVPTGYVTYTLDGTPIIVLSLDSTGSLNYFLQNYISSNLLAPGKHTITASYLGDNSFKPSVSAPFTFTVGGAQAATFILPSTSSAVAGQPVALMASLASAALTPTGTVQIYDNGVAFGPVLTLSSNGPQGSGVPQAEYDTSSLAVGTHTLTLSYSGDSVFPAVPATSNYAEASTITITAPVKAAAVTQLTNSVNTVPLGQTYQYTVKVASAKAGGAVPTGTVQIINIHQGTFATTIAAATPLVNGAVTIPITLYTGGSLDVYASYSGDGSYDPSISPLVLTTITALTPTITLKTNSTYFVPGQQTSLMFTATGYPNNLNYTVPSGYVFYTDSLNGAAAQGLGYGAITSGSGSIGINAIAATLQPGTHVLAAQYLGDGNWASATVSTTIIVTASDFTLSTPSGATAVTTGASGSAAVVAMGVAGFASTVAFQCASGVPVGLTCSASPASALVSGAGSAIAVTINAPAPSVAELKIPALGQRAQAVEFCLAGGVAGALLGVFLLPGRRRRLAMLASLLLVVAMIPGCAGSDASFSNTTTTLRPTNGAKIAQGSVVQLAATVMRSDGSAVASGTVVFKDGTTLLGTASVANGVATLPVSSLAVGVHGVTASYAGDGNDGGSASAVFNEAITGGFVVQVTGVSGSSMHTLPISFVLQ